MVLNLEWKEGDIFRWSYNSKTMKEKTLQIQAGTLYWCVSRIGIVKSNKLVDTYWYSSDNTTFTKERAMEILDLEFIANMGDLENVDSSQQAYYEDKDCVNLNHANSTRGNFYIRKGAVKSLDKMKRILERQKVKYIADIGQLKWSLELVQRDIDNLTQDSYICVSKDISLSDRNYLDEPKTTY